MTLRTILIAAAGMMPAALAAPAAGAMAAGAEEDIHERRVLVRFHHDAAGAVRAAGGRLGDAVGRTGFRRVRVPDAEAALIALGGDPRVAEVVPDVRRRASAGDPMRDKTGEQRTLDLIRAPQAWQTTQGAGAVVAILDTGVDLDHPDLKDRILPGRDVVGNDASADDPDGHGTAVAGVAAAGTGNGIGIAGVAGAASIVPVRVLGDDGDGWDSDIAAGIDWAATQGADVINLSLGGPGDSPVLREAAEDAIAAGSVVVAAAGDEGTSEPQYPAAIPGVLAVSALHRDGSMWEESGHGAWVDVAAPGVDVLTTSPPDDGIPWASAGTDSVTGTSFAAPHVTGVAALVRAAHTAWSPAQVRDAILGGATESGPPGRDPYYGAGRLDAAAALGAPRSPPVVPDPGDRFEPDDDPDAATDIGPAIPDDPAPFWARRATLAPEGDVDWIAADLEPGWYDAKVVHASAHRVRGSLQVRDPQGRLVAGSVGSPDETPKARFFVPAASRFVFRVVNAAAGTGAYDITIDPLDEDLAPPDALFPEEHLHRLPGTASSVATGHLDGDGLLDALAGTTEGPFTLLQDGDGWLGAPQPLPVGGVVSDVAVGDVDGDGDDDAIVAHDRGFDVHLRQAGALAPLRTVATPPIAEVALGDVDSDGRDELAVLGAGGALALHEWNGTTWTSGARASPGAYAPRSLDAGDVTGDGRADLLVTGFTAGGVTLYAGRAAGGVDPPRRIAEGVDVNCCLSAFAGDVTGDGLADVLLTGGSSLVSSITVMRALGGGAFAPPEVRSGPGAHPLAVAELTGDGVPDVWAGGFLFPGLGGGAPAPWRAYPDLEVEDLALADLSGDGLTDVVTAGSASVRVHVHAGPPSGAVPWVRATAPRTGAANVVAGASIGFDMARELAAPGPDAVTIADANGARVPATVSYDAGARRVSAQPSAPLAAGTYDATLAGVRDTAGRTMREPHVVRFTVGPAAVDTDPPETYVRSGPGPVTSFDSFMIDADEPVAAIECAWPGREFAPCDPQMAPTLSEPYTAQFRAVDLAGNVDPTPAAWSIASPGPETGSSDSDDAAAIGGAEGSAEAVIHAAAWWRWVAPATGPVRFSTRGSEVDTVLTAYDAGLLVRDSNDDADPSRSSAVTLDAVAGRTYFLAVTGFGRADSGRVRLSWGRDPAATPVVMTGGAGDLTAAGGITLRGTVNPHGAAASWRFEWGETTAYGAQSPLTAAGAGQERVEVAHAPSGLVAGRTYHYRLVAVTAAGTVGGMDGTFLAPWTVGIRTGAASAVTPGTARLGWEDVAATVGGRCAIEWGETTAYGTRTEGQCSRDGVDVERLRGGATYHYRAILSEDGRTVRAADRTFTTPPATAPGALFPQAQDVRGNRAELTSRIDANGSETAWSVEYGTTTDYGQRTPERSVGLGRPLGNIEERAVLRGLEGGTTYHARFVATNAKGTTRGPDVVFTTLEPAPTLTIAPPEVAPGRARLRATVDPHGSQTDVVFEYQRAGASPFEWTRLGEVTVREPQEVERVITTNLVPGVTYRFRLVADSFNGETAPAPVPFTMPTGPAAVKDAAARALPGGSARIQASVDPAGLATTWWVEYGATGAYGSSTPARAIAGNVARILAADVPGPAPGGQLRWRVVARNANGEDAAEGMLVGGTATPTPTPTTTPTPEPDATATATPDPGGSPTAAPGGGDAPVPVVRPPATTPAARVPARLSLAALRRGLPLRISCPLPCAASVRATHGGRRAGRLTRRLGAGEHRIRLRLSRAALRRLGRSRSRVVRVAVRIEAGDAVRATVLRIRVTRR